ncbi:hypothetical protein GGR51DRAFT_524402 [Nemania sp. FL0031]|nr:hypothetical protein GGR51DRAFT_524402 [Nemania sp. FL0031]
MDRQPQQALIEQSTSHRSSRSSQRPISLTPKQSRSVTQHPKILRLTRQLRQIPQQTPQKKDDEGLDKNYA